MSSPFILNPTEPVTHRHLVPASTAWLIAA
jgi:hypothetical protein